MGNLLCRIGLHRYRDTGLMIGLLQLVSVCRRCDQGRVFSALGGYYYIVPPEDMRKALAEFEARQDR